MTPILESGGKQTGGGDVMNGSVAIMSTTRQWSVGDNVTNESTVGGVGDVVGLIMGAAISLERGRGRVRLCRILLW